MGQVNEKFDVEVYIYIYIFVLFLNTCRVNVEEFTKGIFIRNEI